MPQVFSFRWPHFARLQAILFFPVAVMLAIETTRIVSLAGGIPITALAALVAPYGIREHDILWALIATMAIPPYAAMLLVTDRLLTVRKGYALVSILAVAAWSFSAFKLSEHLARFTPDVILNEVPWYAFSQAAAGAVGTAVFLLHLRPLWIGFRDGGEVVDRLTAYRDPHPNGQRTHGSRSDLYRRRTEDFRLWQTANDKLPGRDVLTKEAPAVRLVYAITWVAVVIGGSLAFFGRGGLGLSPNVPIVAIPAALAPPDVKVVAQPPASGPAPVSTARVQVVPPAPVLPVVQRPGMPSFADRPQPGSNEAIAERGHDGHFTFDATVNGTRIPMLFDTGASVIAIRSEDAVRLGIPPAKLNYSAKVKTANGVADVAPVMIDTVSIGNITLRNVQGFVARQGVLQENLLGQAFLARLAGYSVENNRLVLKGR